MYLTIDGQKRFRSTETSDYDDAIDKLREWETQAKIGHVLRMPGFLTKNKEAYSLALADESGKPFAETAFLVNMKNRLHGAPVFDMTNFRQEWRAACAKLKLGVFNPKTRIYRGAQPHDFRRTAITNFAASGVNEDAAISVTGHKTASAHKRYKIGGTAVQRTALGAVSKAR
jgi:integrase